MLICVFATKTQIGKARFANRLSKHQVMLVFAWCFGVLRASIGIDRPVENSFEMATEIRIFVSVGESRIQSVMV